ncbi:hypothetical protein Droror1_Dr00026887 [Drosera rotundifolia]
MKQKTRDSTENIDSKHEAEGNSSVVTCKERIEEASHASKCTSKLLKRCKKPKKEGVAENTDTNREVQRNSSVGLGLPWEEDGDYDESNTLLLDDSLYKALRNPPNTAVFPYPYDYRDEKDRSLGPQGDLRIYLEKLADADDVQAFVEASPFGQSPIIQTNESWPFYAKIIAAKDDKQQNSDIVVATVWCGTRKKF